jgi:hypothetical protein
MRLGGLLTRLLDRSPRSSSLIAGCAGDTSKLLQHFFFPAGSIFRLRKNAWSKLSLAFLCSATAIGKKRKLLRSR